MRVMHLVAAVALWGPYAQAQVMELDFGAGSSLSIVLEDGQKAHLSRDGDIVTLSGPAGSESRYDVPLFQPEIDRMAGLAGDINGDGRTDLMIRTDIGYGGVNLFYAPLIRDAEGGWREAGAVANPEFTPGHTGFTTSARSGPFWYRERWDIGPDGLPYRQAQHTITFAGFELREVFAADGTALDRMVVAEGLGLHDEMSPLTAIVGPEGASAQSPEPDGMAIALWLEPETAVTLTDWDQASMLVEVETGEGTRLWVDPEALALE